jgi:hypothetical protein
VNTRSSTGARAARSVVGARGDVVVDRPARELPLASPGPRERALVDGSVRGPQHRQGRPDVGLVGAGDAPRPCGPVLVD